MTPDSSELKLLTYKQMRNRNTKLTMSVPKSMHKMVTVPRGSGTSHRMNAKKGEISGMLDVRV
jgi:hypothetical protein